MTTGARYSVVFLFVLAFVLAGGSYWLSVSAVRGEVSSRASVVELCQAGNQARAQQVTLWTHLVQVSKPPPNETPAQERQRQATIRVFLGYVRKVFQQRHCTALYGTSR